ncbi:MAG: hypothetical protein WCI73_16470 [Phycisphaerae bacterium]
MKRHLWNILTVLSALLCVAIVALLIMSHFMWVGCWWSQKPIRHEVSIGHGALIVVVMNHWELDEPFAWSYERSDYAKNRAIMQQFPAWWHGDNSWWESIGWRVTSRQRFLGFEVAHGTYIPEFRLQIPTSPFQLYQVPLWTLILPPLIPPICWAFAFSRRKRRLRSGLCVTCGYDLRASKTRCPECGSPIPVPTATQAN